MDTKTFHRRIEDLETLMQAKLGGSGKTLVARFRRAGRSLPKRVQRAGRVITEAQKLSTHPKLARLQNSKALSAAFNEVISHLETIDPSDRRKGLVLGVLGGLVFNLILLAAAVLLMLRWQGAL